MSNGQIDKLIRRFITDVDLRLTQSRRAVAYVEQELLAFFPDTDILHPKRKVAKPLDSADPHPPIETPLHNSADRIIGLIRMARRATDCPIAPDKESGFCADRASPHYARRGGESSSSD